MAQALDTVVLLRPAAGETTPPIVVRQDDELGILALGECDQPGPDGEAAVHLVLNTLCNQLELHQEQIEGFREHPDDATRAVLLEALEEALGRAGGELYMFSRRRRGRLGVGVEVIMPLGREVFLGHVGPGGTYLLRRDLLHRLAQGRRAPRVGGPPAESRWTQPLQEPALLGRDSKVDVEIMVFEAWPGDRLALVSRAVAERLGDADVRTLLACLEPAQALRGLLHMARERGAVGALGALVAQVPGRAEALDADLIDLLPVLASMPLLAWCSREELLDVAAVARPQRVAAGEKIFGQGDLGNEFYLLVSGEVSVVSEGTGLARLGPGSTFGEMAILDQPERSATVSALVASDLLVIPREAFFALLKSDPTLAVKLLWNLLLRVSGNLRRTTAQMAGLVSGSLAAEVGEEDEPTAEVTGAT